MTLRFAMLKIALFGLVSWSLSGCVLDESEKTSCDSQSDCLDGYSCTSDNVCEPTISLRADGAPFDPDAFAVDADGGAAGYPDAAVYDSDAAVDDLDGGSGGVTDAAVDDLDGGSGGVTDAAVDDLDGGSGGETDGAL